MEAGEPVLPRVGRVVDRRVVADAAPARRPAARARGRSRASAGRCRSRRRRARRSASCTAKPSGPGSKYRRSRCWNGRHGSCSSCPGRCTLRYFVTTVPSRSTSDRGVVAVAVGRELGVAEMEADAEPRAPRRTAAASRVRHLGLEEREQLVVVDDPAREERRERELREHHQLGALRGRGRAASRAAARRPRRGCSARATGPICAAATTSGRLTRSSGTRAGQLEQHVQQHVGAGFEVGVVGVLGRVVADAAARWARTPCPAGHTRASICASWPAPDGSRAPSDPARAPPPRPARPPRRRSRPARSGPGCGARSSPLRRRRAAQHSRRASPRRRASTASSVLRRSTVSVAPGRDHVDQVRVQLDAPDRRDLGRPELAGQVAHERGDLGRGVAGVVAHRHRAWCRRGSTGRSR